VLTGALRRQFGPPSLLLLRNLHPLDAFIAVEELREVFSLVSVDSDDDPGFTPMAL
jgi:hypothetical protein